MNGNCAVPILPISPLVSRHREFLDAYLPVLGAKGSNISIGRTPVTESEWAKFTGKEVAHDKARFPVTNVSVKDAAHSTRNAPNVVPRRVSSLEKPLPAIPTSPSASFAKTVDIGRVSANLSCRDQ